jgi:hypothetical protein
MTVDEAIRDMVAELVRDEVARTLASNCRQHFDEGDTAEWLTTGQAARYLGLTPKTLANWRSLGTGPSFKRMGRGIRYRRDSLAGFVAGGR